ncbi:TRAP transporter substrate-binding protein [Wenxinia saemankumensis]|uniref:TRAP-type C4-dicarboxylate transport system, substrate-binding protein n=1 Tax=Wenxinia saemankumensis TaxID=1447782 RepID=A0A1M6A5H7_9RHOB|nr:TRAP transporter substrate-binding protein [Wenxinia saemankumensis]SHI31453.1 TRAP-type C4-dicarboxylate transport system, substrate-binding protein [Wenxinia saemankumensis]
MTKTIRAAIGGVALSALAATGALAQDVTLRLHQFLPQQSGVPANILQPWADRLEEQSSGRIAVEMFPAMSLGGAPPELIDQAIDGIADVIWTVVGYTPGRFPSTEVFELPFFVESAEAASCAYWTMFEERMAGTEFAEVKVLGTWVHGPGLLHTNTPVSTPADMQGLQIRGGSRLVNRLLEVLGATPVGLPVPGVPEALSQGVIDGTTVPWEVTPSIRLTELVTNHTEFTGPALYNLTFVLAMNRDTYESMPEDLRAIVDANSGLDFSMEAGRIQQSLDAAPREAAIAAGNNVIVLDEAQTQEWRDLAQPIYDEWVADMDGRGLDGQAMIDEARALMETCPAE